MGRYVLNQTSSTIEKYFCKPLDKGTIVNDQSIFKYSTAGLRKLSSDFPPDGEFKITFIKGKAQRISVSPDFPAQTLFQYIFQYQASTEIVLEEYQITGGYKATICLGDGIAADIELTGAGGLANSTTLYYDFEFASPYDILIAQSIKVNPQLVDNFANSIKEAEYSWLSVRRVTESDLQKSDTELAKLYLMRNSIYAHKGLIFRHRFPKAVFERQKWYYPFYKTHQFREQLDNLLSPIEKYNINFITRYEKSL